MLLIRRTGPLDIHHQRSKLRVETMAFCICLRRYDHVKSMSPKIAHVVLEKWALIDDHPGLCRLEQLFLAQRAVFAVHTFALGSRSLLEYFGLSSGLSEQVLWSVTCQMVSTLRRVHAANLAVRTMDLKHTLCRMDVASHPVRMRVMFNCCGIVDALEYETCSRKPIAECQQEDIRNLGRLVLSLATGTEITAATDNDTLNRCERFCVTNYSREFHNLCFTLIRTPVPPSIVDISRAMAGRALDELDAAQMSLNQTEVALAAEYESGRALRLLLKLGFVNERPEFGPNRRWAQSGDCYVLTLFRDYGTQ